MAAGSGTSRWRRFFAPAGLPASLLLVALVAATYLLRFPPLVQAERQVYDGRLRGRPARAEAGRVAAVVVDEQALRELGRWPWPRTVFARLIERLNEAGAKVIAFDMAFLEPDAEPSKKLLRRVWSAVSELGVENADLATALARLGKETDTDRAFADAIAASEAAVVLGYYFHLDRDDFKGRLTPEGRDELLGRIEGSAFEPQRFDGDPPTLIRAFIPQPSVAELAAQTPHAGYLETHTDSDGGLRAAPLVIECGSRVYPSLPVRAAQAFRGDFGAHLEVSEFGMEGIRLGRDFVPTDEHGRVLVNYLGPSGTFPVRSIAAALDPDADLAVFRDRVVLVGGTAKGIGKTFPTPVDSKFPGVELHATLIDNLLTGEVMVRPLWYRGVDLALILLVGGLVALLIRFTSYRTGLIGSILVGVAYAFFGRWVFASQGANLTLVAPLAAVGLLVVKEGLTQFFQEEAKRKQVEGAFGRYVPPKVVAEMLTNPDQMKLGGEIKTLTVLFSDLAGFTSCVETHTPAEVVELMSEYFEEMTERVFDTGGLLKEYVGDEIMAIFGAPIPQADHAKRACRSAILMRDRLAELRSEWASQGRPPLRARWGVNSGPMLVGNLGSSYRFSYGVLGDDVNLGSRLEGLNSQYGTQILVGQNTRELIGDDFVLREVDAVRVKGKSLAVRVYELISEPGGPGDEASRIARHAYAEALAFYRDRRWDEAAKGFESVLSRAPEDGPAAVMLRRVESLRADPPGEDWDGVFTATKK